MKFSDILKAVRNAWAFAWPPVVAVAVVVLIADFVSLFSARAWIGDGLNFIREKLAWLKELRELLGDHGMEKVLQAFAGVLLVVMLYLIKHVVLSIVGMLPPYFETSRARLLLRILPETEAARLFRRYPEADRFSEAFQWAEADYRATLPKPLEDPQPVGEVVGQLAKLGAVVAILVTIFGEAAIGRMLVVILACAVVWFGTAIVMLKDTEARLREHWFQLRKTLLAETSGLKREGLSAEELARVEAEAREANSKRWWQIKFLNHRSLAWMRKNLLNR